MKDRERWQYDEFRQVGKDYSKPAEVEMYDKRHADFRDIEKDSNAVLDSLGVRAGDVVIDFGAGTGTFAVQAAIRGARVHAVDVSQPMLDYAREKAARAGVSITEFHHDGFLSFEFEDQAADVIVTTFALHHLPDFWKGIALNRMYRMLRPAGQLYIHDVVIEEHDAIDNIAALIRELTDAGGDFLREDTEGHFKEEFSTYDWIMDGLLLRAGFTIERKDVREGVIATYCCTRKPEAGKG